MSLPCVSCEIYLMGFKSFAQHLLDEHFCYECVSRFTGPNERRSCLWHSFYVHGGNKPRCKLEVVNRFAEILPIFWKESDDSLSYREKFDFFLSSSWSKFLEVSLQIYKIEDSQSCTDHNDSQQSASESIDVAPSTSTTSVLRDASNETLRTDEKLGLESSNSEDADAGVENFGELYENPQIANNSVPMSTICVITENTQASESCVAETSISTATVLIDAKNENLRSSEEVCVESLNPRDASVGVENFDQMRVNTPVVANADCMSTIRVNDENTAPASSFVVENAIESVAVELPIATTNKKVRGKRGCSEIAGEICATKMKRTQSGKSSGNVEKSGAKCRKSENLVKSKSSSAAVFASVLKQLSSPLKVLSAVSVTPPHCSGFFPPGGAANGSSACIQNQNEKRKIGEVENISEEEILCQICSKIFQPASIVNHVLKHFQDETGVILFQCSTCSFPFKTKGAIFQHLKRVHGFLSANQLKTGVHYVDGQLLHKERIAEVRRRAFPEYVVAQSSQKISVKLPAVCRLCKGTVFTDARRHVIQHVPKICRIKWFYKCLQCQFTSLYVPGIRDHMRKRHGKVGAQAGVHYAAAESIEECIRMAISRCFRLK